MLMDAIELEYFGILNRIVLYKCHWFDIEREVRIRATHGLIEIKYTSILCSNEKFVLIAQATQVYNRCYPLTLKG